VAVGESAGWAQQGEGAVAVGREAALADQSAYAVAIGYNAGADTQGAYSIAIGQGAGTASQPANSIIINSSADSLNTSTAGLYINPIRNTTGNVGVLQYNNATKEVSYSTNVTLGNVTLGNIIFADSTVQNTAYTGFTANSANWSNPAPTTLNDAIDRLAILVKALNSGTGA
jgi:hypothetical protein